MAKSKLEQITNEIDGAVGQAKTRNDLASMLSPFRLLLVWVKGVNSELKQVRKELRELREYMQSDDEDLVK
ncbi:hypothetical protein [Enterovibrio calviensis]|uniref:hypothetical protein n=1 Tax=Enterovibrio calviensis TaxID=91359 RepID=UPI000481E3E1|nr:hypothetical protein [Enterovibrio calviensis]